MTNMHSDMRALSLVGAAGFVVVVGNELERAGLKGKR